MTKTTKYDKKERRVNFPAEFDGDMIKVERIKAFNKVFDPLLDPLTEKGRAIARIYLVYSMKLFIPIESLPDLKKDYLQVIKPALKEGRF